MAPNNGNDLAYVKYYHSDLLLSTEGWPPFAQLVYLWLIVSNWYHGPLPTSERRLAEKCGLPLAQFRPLWRKYIRRKFLKVKGGLTNPRATRDRENGIAKREASVEFGRRGGLASARKRGLGGPQLVGDGVTDLVSRMRESSK
jgi:hypothetical protein